MVGVAHPLCAEGDFCKACNRVIEWDGHTEGSHLRERIQELEQEIRDLWGECDRSYEIGYADGMGDANAHALVPDVHSVLKKRQEAVCNHEWHDPPRSHRNGVYHCRLPLGHDGTHIA